MNKEEIKTYIKDKKDDYELIASRRDIDRDIQERALNVVKEFISERNLILYGGLAIDYALRLKGTSIYSDDELPDYDCLSSNSVNDAYDLAEILQKKGFAKVNVIRAIHIQTMKVRVDFIVVADISYCPQSVFEKLDTLQYKELKVLHPYFQRIDMHLSLSFPFMTPPNVTIFHRWKKDIKRINMFFEHYPVNKTLEYSLPAQSQQKKEITLPARLINNIAFHGQIGYNILYKALEYTLSEMKIQKDISHLPRLDIKLEKISKEEKGNKNNDNNIIKITYESYEDKFVIISSEPEKTATEISGKISRYNSLMEFRPEYLELTDNHIQIYSTEDQLLSISVIDVDGIKVKIPSPQYLLIYFMINALMAKTDDETTYKMNMYFYNAVTDIISIANDIFKNIKDPKIISYCPFFLPLQLLGQKNEHQSYKTQKIDSKIKLGIATEEEKALFKTLPKKGYYLDQDPERPKQQFDYNHKWFLRDGSIRKDNV
jgi:hypothetical protein